VIPALTERERLTNRREAQLRGLQKVRAARPAAREDQRRRLAGDATGWHRVGAADWRLNAFEANAAAALLERNGWRAEAVNLAQGVACVEVRDLAVRDHPRVTTLRRPGEAEAWVRMQGHGLRGRGRAALPAGVPAPPDPARHDRLRAEAAATIPAVTLRSLLGVRP
jgi:hypothetical protein